MSRLLEMPDATRPLGRRDRAILELFYASGLRLSELVGLDVDDVNLSSRTVRVLGKGRKERLVPFNTSTEAALRAWLQDWEALTAGSAGDAAGAREPHVPGCSTRATSCAPRDRRVTAPRGDAAVLELSGKAALDAKRRSPGAEVRRAVQHAVRHQPARPAPFVRDAPARARRRPALDPGAARPRPSQHDPALHARQRRAAD